MNRRRLDYWLHRRRRERELAEEMAFHRAELARRGDGGGFGNALLAQEDARAVWLAPWIESVCQDLRIGARMLRRSPVTTLVAIATMALGVGANTAVYTLVDASLFRPLQVREPERLVFFAKSTKAGLSEQDFTFDEYERLRAHNRTASGIAAYDSSRVSATVGGNAEMLEGDFVTGNYFDVLGVIAGLGRTLQPADDVPGAPGAVVLSDGYWHRRFSGDAAAIGRAITLGGLPCTVVGVLPAAYHGRTPAGTAPDITLSMPAHAQLALADHTTFSLVARLLPGVSREQARADFEGIVRQARAEHPRPLQPSQDAEPWRLAMIAGASGAGGGTLGPNDTRQVVIAAALVGALLLIVCVNVATLLFARAAARRKEIAVRLSIGAGPRRLLRQFLTESVLLATLGGAASLVVAASSAHVLARVLPLADLTVSPAGDTHALLFTVLLSLACGLPLGLAPAAAARKIDVSPVLKMGDAAWLPGASRRLSGMSLVIAQVAISIALLGTTGLLLKSLVRLQRVDTGISADHVLDAGIYPVLLRYDRPHELLLYQRLLERLETTPGVASASLSRYWIGRGGLQFASPRLFETLGLPILDGRDLTAADVTSRARVAVLNETAMRRWFQDGNAIGRRIPDRFTEGYGPLVVIGVAHDVSTSYRRAEAEPAIFAPYTLAGPEELGQAYVLVRTQADAASMIDVVRRVVAGIEPNLALLNLEPLFWEFHRSLDPQRTTAALAGTCGLLALALVAIALYGALAHAVVRRTRELGIRLSLGATRAEVMGMVLRQSAIVIAIGVAVGVPLTAAAARGLSPLLFDVGESDVLPVAAAVVLLFVVALAAAYIPARRASRVDPLVAMRYE